MDSATSINNNYQKLNIYHIEKRVKKTKIYDFFKRCFDIIMASFGLIILVIPMIIIGIGVKLSSKGPILFKQKKYGKNKRVFIMYKFRSMSINAPKEAPTCQFEHPEQYITKFGKFLRKTSLDELPQLINILKGDMSIIGPRPAMIHNEEILIMLRDINGANYIRPGLSGLAQVNGRDSITILSKANYDGIYYEKRSLFLDIKIFFKTIIKVLKKSDIVDGGNSNQYKCICCGSKLNEIELQNKICPECDKFFNNNVTIRESNIKVA